jgi:hypothetical protein
MPQGDIGVEEKRDAIEDGAPASGKVSCRVVPVAQFAVFGGDGAEVAQRLYLRDLRRRMDMIEKTRESGEAFVAHELFVVDAPVRLSKDLMSLAWNPAEAVVDGHRVS